MRMSCSGRKLCKLVVVPAAMMIMAGCASTKATAPAADTTVPMPPTVSAAQRTVEPSAEAVLLKTEQHLPSEPVIKILSSETSNYTVKSGDTMSGIAGKCGIKTKELATLNGLPADKKLKIGQVLKVPASAKLPVSHAAPAVKKTSSIKHTAKPAAKAESSKAVNGVYTVKSGDSLAKIAHANKTTAEAIKKANNLTSDRLSIGQKLTMPGAGDAAATAKDLGTEPTKAVTTGKEANPFDSAPVPAPVTPGQTTTPASTSAKKATPPAAVPLAPAVAPAASAAPTTPATPAPVAAPVKTTDPTVGD